MGKSVSDVATIPVVNVDNSASSGASHYSAVQIPHTDMQASEPSMVVNSAYARSLVLGATTRQQFSQDSTTLANGAAVVPELLMPQMRQLQQAQVLSQQGPPQSAAAAIAYPSISPSQQVLSILSTDPRNSGPHPWDVLVFQTTQFNTTRPAFRFNGMGLMLMADFNNSTPLTDWQIVRKKRNGSSQQVTAAPSWNLFRDFTNKNAKAAGSNAATSSNQQQYGSSSSSSSSMRSAAVVQASAPPNTAHVSVSNADRPLSSISDLNPESSSSSSKAAGGMMPGLSGLMARLSQPPAWVLALQQAATGGSGRQQEQQQLQQPQVDTATSATTLLTNTAAASAEAQPHLTVGDQSTQTYLFAMMQQDNNRQSRSAEQLSTAVKNPTPAPAQAAPAAAPAQAPSTNTTALTAPALQAASRAGQLGAAGSSSSADNKQLLKEAAAKTTAAKQLWCTACQYPAYQLTPYGHCSKCGQRSGNCGPSCKQCCKGSHWLHLSIECNLIQNHLVDKLV
jgi:hypothetical protein